MGQVSPRGRRRGSGRRAAAALAAVLALGAGAPPAAGATSPSTADTPGAEVCTVTDPRLAQLSGLALRGDVLYAVSDQSATVFELDESCGVVSTDDLPEAVDVEDLEATADGLLWVGDIGGNRAPRQDVTVLRYNPASGNVTALPLRYPDGPHDAEALLVTPTGRVLVVTKEESGVSRVFSTPAPVDPATTTELEPVADLDLRSFEGRTRGNGSVLVTGGSVSADGTHVVLRSYLDAFEWDAPDGDVVRALTSGPPRVIPLPAAPQGEAIAYDAQGLALFTGGEQLPSVVHRVDVVRPRAAAAAGAEAVAAPWVPALRWVALAAAAAAALGVVLSLVRSLWFLRRARRSRRPAGVRG